MERTTAFAYDKLGRLLTVTQPDPDGGGALTAPVTSYGYDAVGNLLSVTDPLSHVTTYGYDDLYRRTSITDALSGVTSFTFDAAGQLKTLTDPVSNTTEWFYDGLGRVIEEENELGKSRFFAYDAVGNLTERTDRNGRVIEYVYDELNRNTDEKWYEDSSLIRTISFDFDAANQLLNAQDPSATNHFTYDKLGRVTSEVQTIAGFGDTLELAQEFDALGNRTKAEFTFGTLATLRTDYVYDGLSRMTQQTQYDSTSTDIAWKRATFEYNAASQFSEINRFVGDNTTPIAVATTTYAYDGIGRLTDLLHFTDTTTWAGYEYEYDATSRITAIDSFVDGLTEYDYDNTNQLTDADYASLTDEAYSYDANGNRTMSGHVVGDNNQLESDGTYNYAYDDEGNRTSRTNISTGYVTEYTWDHRNRLVAVTELDDEEAALSSVAYTYDAFDRWVSRSYDSDGPGGSAAVDSIFAHDGDQVALEFEDSTGSVEGEDLTHTYSWGPVIDQLLADESFGEEPLWGLSDHLGTPRDLVAYNEGDHESELRNHRIYDSYGTLQSQSSITDVTFVSFTGRIEDQFTRLVNFRSRWQDSEVGIWLSVDTIGFHGRDANLYSYVFNSPVMFVDPMGTVPPPGPLTPQQIADAQEHFGFSDAETDQWLAENGYSRAPDLRELFSPSNQIIQRYGPNNPYPNPTRFTVTLPTSEEVAEYASELTFEANGWLIGGDGAEATEQRFDDEEWSTSDRAFGWVGVYIVRWAPGVSDVGDFAELKTGKCLLTGEELTDLEYTVTLVMLFVPVVPGGAVRGPVRNFADFITGIGRRPIAGGASEIIEGVGRRPDVGGIAEAVSDTASSSRPPGMSLDSPSDPQVDRFAADWEDELNRLVEERMRQIGVPEEMIGGNYNGQPMRAFTIQGSYRIGGNMRPGTSTNPGIFVDQGVLDPCHRIGEDIPSWQSAKLVDRIDAAIAHEFEEFISNGFDPHNDAIDNAPETILDISEIARQLLEEYRNSYYR